MPDTPAVETPAASNGADLRPIARRHIVIRGARQHNLKNIDLDLPKGKLIVFTGPSGSGKSSLAFDTIYAEGQRRYVESLSAYARQFLERMDKPDVDLITGLAPAIAIEQKTISKNPRSTVATQTEIYDHLRLLFARIGTTISPVSGEPVTKDSPRSVAEALTERLEDRTRFYLCFPLPAHKKASVRAELEALQARGFFRLVVLPTEKQAEKGETESVLDLNETPPEKVRVARERLLVLVDRLAIRKGDEATRSRIADSVEQAFREGGGRCVALVARGGPMFRFSEHFERDGLTFEEPTPQLFAFNSPVGACPTCQGFGRVPGIDEDLVVPNPDLSIRQGALAPFRTEQWSAHFRDLIRVAAQTGMNIDVPYHQLSDDEKRIIWEGRGDYVGLYGFFRFLEKHSYKMHYRIFHARFRGYTRCPDCRGYRLRPEALYVQVGGHHIGELCELTIKDAHAFFDALTLTDFQEKVAGRILEEIRRRLRYLVDVGLDYLTLDRLSQTLSGGESQRINLATSLGSSLVGSLYVLDEPTIGLHPRDTDRLVRILEHLRDIGNTVLVVEHEADVMRRADQIVDLGPGSGRFGGEVVFQGDYEAIRQDERSLTGAYLSGRRQIAVPATRRPVREDYQLVVENARQHNLKRLTVQIPLGMIVCVTGVSGSGKSTLVHDTLYQALRRLKGQSDGSAKVGAHDALRGHPLIDQVEMVDQSPIGRTPRSNPVTYTKAFDAIREVFAATREARLRGLRPGYFSFNVPGGRCEQCQGEGVIKVEMQFLADLYLECEACKGTRYKRDVLEIRYRGKTIHDVLSMTVDEAAAFFEDQTPIRNKLAVLQDIGLGYLTLGQPSTTLSGGEAQRIKLAAHLGKTTKDHTLYLFDEPTTGLHFADIEKLLRAFNALVEQGHSVLLVEHNIDVIKSADWVIDLGPEGGVRGGFIVAEGTPEDLAAHPESHTGRFLREVL
ncbi:excinuclease ABC subunit A [Rhodothermaceae bacterium RA]|nr:excinuclease ABC subunit A [Rhodothermaceae bacterium RA]